MLALVGNKSWRTMKQLFLRPHLELLRVLVMQLLRPHLEFCVEFWSCSYRKDVIKLEKMQGIYQMVAWACGLEE